MTPRLSPRTIQLVGLCLLVGSAVFWMLSGRQSIELVSASMTLITLGAFWNASETLDKSSNEYRLPEPPTPTPPPTPPPAHVP